MKDKRVLLGVTGSIAAYKAAELASKMAQAEVQVDVVLTAAAMKFVTPLTFQSVTGRQAYTDEDLWGSQGHVLHIGLARRANALVIAPATANTLAKLANGLADNLLSLAALAANCPLVLVPAMDGGMFSHPATQENLEKLRQRGAVVIGPVEGHLASGLSGVGRMEEPLKILAHLRYLFSRQGSLAGCRIVVTAGGTQEPIDAVRMVTNRSSGRQGYALAQAAVDMGAEVTLISAPTSLQPPQGVNLIPVTTAQEMLEAVLQAIPQTDALVMAAAVADYTPARPKPHKIKKDEAPLSIQLQPTQDILIAVAEYKKKKGHPRVCVGFAAESRNLLENARHKLAAKRLDLIAANDILAQDAGFGVETNRVTLIFADGKVENLPLMSKTQVAETIMERVASLLTSGPGE